MFRKSKEYIQHCDLARMLPPAGIGTLRNPFRDAVYHRLDKVEPLRRRVVPQSELGEVIIKILCR